MKDIHNKILYYFLSLLIVLINNVYSQETHSYNIDAKLDFLGNTPLKIFSSSNLICAEKVDED